MVQGGEVVTVQYAERQPESGEALLVSSSPEQEVGRTQEGPGGAAEKKKELLSQLNSMQEQLQILKIMSAP